MFTIKRPLYALSNKFRRQSGKMKEKWTADFSKPEKSCFDIKPEISYNAYIEKGSLFLGLKKKNCMARIETSERVYVDQVINARLRIDPFGSNCAAGIMFRVMERGTGTAGGTYYLVLISGKGNFRFDAIKNGIPKPLIGWTEAPGLNETGANLTIIARGDHIIIILNGRWIAETYDDSVPGGHLGFSLISYDPDQTENSDTPQIHPTAVKDHTTSDRYSCRAWLDFLSVNSRAGAVEAEYKKWKNSVEITAESRLRLAESLAVLNFAGPAYDQVLKAWKQREEVARSVSATYSEMRTKGELLLAARLAEQLGRLTVAEEYIDSCLAMGADGAAKSGDGAFGGDEIMEAFAEKVKILSSLNKFGDLAAFLPVYINRMRNTGSSELLPTLYALLGHARWNLKDYEAAAKDWDTAFNLNQNNGLYAANAANAYELMGRNETALQRLLVAGNIFLQQEDYTELGALIPKLFTIGEKNPEVRLLAGKYAFGTGDHDRAEAELVIYEELRLAAYPVQEADPAVHRILGEILSRKKPAETVIPVPEEAPAWPETATLPVAEPAETVVPVPEEIPVEVAIPVPGETPAVETPAYPEAVIVAEPAETPVVEPTEAAVPVKPEETPVEPVTTTAPIRIKTKKTAKKPGEKSEKGLKKPVKTNNWEEYFNLLKKVTETRARKTAAEKPVEHADKKPTRVKRKKS